MEPREYIDTDGHAHRTWEHGLARSYVADEEEALRDALVTHTAAILKAIEAFNDNVRHGVRPQDLGSIVDCMMDAADDLIPADVRDEFRPLLAREMLKGVK